MAERKPRTRTRTLKVLPVSMDVDETTTHWLVFVSPHPEAQALGISYHRARLPKCLCKWPGHLGRDRCSSCGSFHPHGMVGYMIKLLRSYPKTSVKVRTVVDDRAGVPAADRVKTVAA
jgi:hypothetical protein